MYFLNKYNGILATSLGIKLHIKVPTKSNTYWQPVVFDQFKYKLLIVYLVLISCFVGNYRLCFFKYIVIVLNINDLY